MKLILWSQWWLFLIIIFITSESTEERNTRIEKSRIKFKEYLNKEKATVSGIIKKIDIKDGKNTVIEFSDGRLLNLVGIYYNKPIKIGEPVKIIVKNSDVWEIKYVY